MEQQKDQQAKQDDFLTSVQKGETDVNDRYHHPISNRMGWTALMIASNRGDKKMVRHLLSNGADVNLQDEKGWSALMNASWKGHLNVIERLVNSGAKVDLRDFDGEFALRKASYNKHFDVVRYLLEHNAEVNSQGKKGWTVLMNASHAGCIKTVECLLQRGAIVNTQRESGRTALISASMNGRDQAAKLLLDNGAEVKITNGEGNTALMYASFNGHCKVAELLVARGALINAQDNAGMSPLMKAIEQKQHDVAKFLIMNHADVNLLNKQGWSALMIAIKVNDQSQTIQLLIEEGADMNQQSDESESPYSLAVSLGDQETVSLLDEYEKKKLLEYYYHGKNMVNVWFIKVILLGPPGLGKTTALRRLTGKITDISSSGEAKQPSTGAVQSEHSVVIRNLSSTTAIMTPSEWIVSKDLQEEVCLLLKFLFEEERLVKTKSETNEANVHSVAEEPTKNVDDAGTSLKLSPHTSQNNSSKNSNGSQSEPEMITLIHEAVSSECWRDLQHFYRDRALLRIEDTGGQPEFMDMLPALTIGPALYLLFCKLTDDLHSPYTVSYCDSSGKFTTPVKSTYTVEEVILSALASVSSLSNFSAADLSTTESTQNEASKKSIAYIVGTHKDLVSDEKIAEFDKKLQSTICSTDFFKEDLVQFSSEERMVLPINNMNGGKSEINEIHKLLEEGMKSHFKKLRVPAAWFILSLRLHKRVERTASLQSVLELAEELGMSEEETKGALWFLHHYAGVLMHFPKLPELRDTVICDTQIVYDSATKLIVNTFEFGSVSKAASERFRKTGQFSLDDIRRATADISGDYIPLQQLVGLLNHLNIIAATTTQSNPTPNSPQNSKVTYFMPCVLENATKEELDKWWVSNSSTLSPAPLCIRYKSGFIPIGVFTAMIANLTGKESLRLISEDVRKNRVQFRMLSGDLNMLTLISQPKYCAIHITEVPNGKTSAHEVCKTARKLVKHTLKEVTSRLNSSVADYQLAFECPDHPGREHLCVIEAEDETPHMMSCFGNADNPQPIRMQDQHLIWFLNIENLASSHEDRDEEFIDHYILSLPNAAHPLLELKLDSHNNVDEHLIAIAYHMADWEENSAYLRLTQVDISDIKETHPNKPKLQRRMALQKWKKKEGFQATYRNLLGVFASGENHKCAETLCDQLRGKHPQTSKSKYRTM